MNWKEFFKPTISKVIIFFLLLLIFGVPASVKQCTTFDFGTGKFPCGPSRFGFHNPVLGSQNLDAATTYSYNFLAIALHLSIVYALLSLIYFYTREKKLQRNIYLTSFIILYVILVIWINFIS